MRIDEDLWRRFGEAAHVRGTDRSTVLRQYIERYIAEEGDSSTSDTGESR